MNDFVQVTCLSTPPSFLKGAARVMDLFGGLDAYRYSQHADLEAITNDWKYVGGMLEDSINVYREER